MLHTDKQFIDRTYLRKFKSQSILSTHWETTIVFLYK